MRFKEMLPEEEKITDAEMILIDNTAGGGGEP